MAHMHARDKKRIAEDIRFAVAYSGRPDKFLYGSDWPLVDMGEYVSLVKNVFPKKFHRQIFFENANRIFRLGL